MYLNAIDIKKYVRQAILQVWLRQPERSTDHRRYSGAEMFLSVLNMEADRVQGMTFGAKEVIQRPALNKERYHKDNLLYRYAFV